jgi:hypothetical protein
MLKKLYGLIRPICPHCDGQGGGMSGYYEPEWSGCRCCDPDEKRIDDPLPMRIWRWHLWLFNREQRREDARLDRWCDRDSDKLDRQDMWRRIQALEKVAHEPYDFTNLIARIDKLDGGSAAA